MASCSMSRSSARISRPIWARRFASALAALVQRPCFQCRALSLARPSAVLAPVDLPPWLRQRALPFIAGFRHGVPFRVLAPQRAPGQFGPSSQPFPASKNASCIFVPLREIVAFHLRSKVQDPRAEAREAWPLYQAAPRLALDPRSLLPSPSRPLSGHWFNSALALAKRPTCACTGRSDSVRRPSGLQGRCTAMMFRSVCVYPPHLTPNRRSLSLGPRCLTLVA